MDGKDVKQPAAASRAKLALPDQHCPTVIAHLKAADPAYPVRCAFGCKYIFRSKAEWTKHESNTSSE